MRPGFVMAFVIWGQCLSPLSLSFLLYEMRGRPDDGDLVRLSRGLDGYTHRGCYKPTNLSRVSCYPWPRQGEPCFTGYMSSVLPGPSLIQLGVKRCHSRDSVTLCHLKVADWTQLWTFAIFQKEIITPIPWGNKGRGLRCVRGTDYT